MWSSFPLSVFRDSFIINLDIITKTFSQPLDTSLYGGCMVVGFSMIWAIFLACIPGGILFELECPCVPNQLATLPKYLINHWVMIMADY